MTNPRTPVAIGPWALVGLLAALALGCGTSPRMKLLTDKQYPPRPANQTIELYQRGVETPHEVIAIIDSRTVDQLTTDTRKRLVEDLRERARRLGADAVINISLLIIAERGWIVDPQTPFHSWRQGWTDLHFLRGQAIRFKPLMIETGDAMVADGERFDFGEGEKPTIQAAPAKSELEVYRTRDAQGRPGWGTRRATPSKPKTPTLETGG